MKLRLVENGVRVVAAEQSETVSEKEGTFYLTHEPSETHVVLHLPPGYDADHAEPVCVSSPQGKEGREGLWLYHRTVVAVDEAGLANAEEIILHVKHLVIKHQKKLDRLRREVEAFENTRDEPQSRRDRIPESVQRFIWQRDGGRCVRCGSQERLEFDHIIPVSRGGATTERNLQLLCEVCNREKSNLIGGGRPFPLLPEES
jgi:HAMP domain-containing protein